MKNTGRQKRNDAILFCVTIVLFVALVILAGYLLRSFSRNTTGGDIPFDLDRITSDSTGTSYDNLSGVLLPEFIGITSGGDCRGISGSVNVTADIYASVAPAVSATMVKTGATVGSEVDWKSFASAEDSVYVRFHTELPDLVIGIFADVAAGESRDRSAVSSYVYEMFVIPGDVDGVGDTVAVRSDTGDVTVYRSESAHISSAELSKLSSSYRSQLKDFIFTNGKYPTASVTEPIFTEPLMTRGIIMSNNVASMAYGSAVKNLMRVFHINPDKLLNTHTDEQGNASYTDRSGVFYHYESAFEYRSTENGGVDVRDIIGYTADVGIKEYISAAKTVIDQIGAVNANYVGGDADMYLSSVSSDGKTVNLEFTYAFDNIRIAETEPAFTASFRDGKMVSARLYTVAVKSVGNRSETFSEWWFFEYLKSDGRIPQNVGPVYRCDFVSESVSVEWSATVINNSRARG